MASETIPGVSFDDLWTRLSSAERSVCACRGYSPDGWRSWIAWDPAAAYSAKDKGTEGFKEFVAAEQERDRRIFGYLAYDLAYALFGITPRAKDALRLPDILFYAFDAYVSFEGGGAVIHAKDAHALAAAVSNTRLLLGRPASVPAASEAAPPLSVRMTREMYAELYTKVKEYIASGHIYQMNLTHRLEGTTSKPARELFSALCGSNPVDFLAYLEGGGFEILSASPERFIKVSKERVIETYPVKGTRPRGDTPEADASLRQELFESEKEAAELNMIVDLLRNDLGAVCAFGSVEVVAPRILRGYASVWHAFAHLKGMLAPGVSAASALLSMFPGGSITGCPKKRAIEIIDELEPERRGVYTGVIGYIDPDDSADFNIAIRTLVKRGREISLQVGGGIVHDSIEENEYRETLDKAASFRDVL